jgi:hypothetical protein
MFKKLSLWSSSVPQGKGMSSINVGTINYSSVLSYPLSVSDYADVCRHSVGIGWEMSVNDFLLLKSVGKRPICIGSDACTGKSSLLSLLSRAGFKCMDGDVLAVMNDILTRADADLMDVPVGVVVASYTSDDWKRINLLPALPTIVKGCECFHFISNFMNTLPYVGLIIPYDDYVHAWTVRSAGYIGEIPWGDVKDIRSFSVNYGYCCINYSHSYAGSMRAIGALMLLYGCSERATRVVIEIMNHVNNNLSNPLNFNNNETN